MSVARLLVASAPIILLLLLAGAWLFAISGGWRLIAAASLALLLWLVALVQHRRFLAERRRPDKLRI